MKLFELASQLAPLMVSIVGGTGLVNDEVIATYDAQAAELAERYGFLPVADAESRSKEPENSCV